MNLPIKLSNGETFYVEVEGEPAMPSAEVDHGVMPKGTAMGSGPTALAEKHLKDVVRVVEGVATEMSEGIVHQRQEHGAMDHLSEMSLELQVGFDAQGKVLFFSSVKASAALKVTLKWQFPKRDAK